MRRLVPVGLAWMLFAALLWLLPQPGVTAAQSSPGTITPPPTFAKVALTDSVTAGSPITFYVHFAWAPHVNTAEDVWITDTLSAGLAFLPGSAFATLAPSPTIVANVLTWRGDVPAGGQVTITYTAAASPAIVLTQTVTNAAVWRGADPDAPGVYVTLTDTISVTVTPRTRTVYVPIILHKWPPLPRPLVQLNNWNFDGGRSGWQEIGGKIIYSDAEKPLPGGSEGYFAWLGGAPNSVNELKQEYAFAADHSALGLYFTYWLASQEETCGDDERIELRVGGEVLWSKQLCSANRTSPPGQPGWVLLDPELDVSEFAGKTVEVSFKSVLNGEDNSNFFLDKVRICTNDPRLTVDRCP